ncbi:MAG: DUF6273 domain-containing protein [Treponema sp.]|uniref:DUF6273 domain-containing protein n=1 Tax=Treponema sp. TaxID=166 RepID=UPI00298E2956|nr:DUF6273 domain-containing protein [Treponema sp.]MCQ2600620.1 DUF6273 domain-containing protein [Treponema sp.]
MKLQKFILSGIVVVSLLMIMVGCSQPESPHVHTFSNAWTTDSTSHWHTATCEHATAVSGKAEHQFPEIWTLVTAATEGSDGLEERFCDVCNYRITQVIPQLNHNHDVAKVWSKDSTKHWHAASCGKVEHNEDVANHTEDAGTVISVPTCTIAGVKTYKCTVCEAVLRTEEIPATGHTTASGKITKVPTYTSKGEVTYECTICRTVLRTEEIAQLYRFHDEPVKLPDGTNGTAGASATYVEFGDWPQSVLPATSTVTVDETIFIIMGANTYYLGTDGNYYVKCAENSLNVNVEYKSAYKYTDGTQAGNGGTTTRYFKVEPIKWRVLTDNYSGKKLLLVENILTANVPYYEDVKNNRTIEGKTVYPNNYKHSQIRAYLNGLTYQGPSGEVTKWNGNGFLQTAFTQNAQNLIAETEVDNSPETTGISGSYYATNYACENTTDKIFLLSVSEVINRGYGFAAYNSSGKGNSRIRFPTDYAKANYAYSSLTDDGFGDNWWIRSPDRDYSFYSSLVDLNGSGHVVTDVDSTTDGIVPALTISF